MEKKKIAVLFGGHSSEYPVSLQSATAVLSNLDTGKYDIIPIGITRAGDWFRYYGSYDRILNNTGAKIQTASFPLLFCKPQHRRNYRI